MAQNPTKADIETLFNRLRAIATNKSCFDCGQKNPTWASVTYGVFICIDCSAVHRSLGVHLTFVRSTNLDTNWTWIQLRQMQLGGNASAGQFFRQHNCNTTDAQQKYNSRAAQLYRDKLSAAAQQAMKIHGTQLNVDGNVEGISAKQEKEEEDFFADCTTNGNSDVQEDYDNSRRKQFDEPVATESAPAVRMTMENTGAPSVDFLNSTVPIEAPKSTIGVRKIQPKKAGIGSAKKGGLGAMKVKTNFADIEQRATMADQMKEAPAPEKKLTVEEEAEAIASVRLAYQDLSVQKTREEERLKATDPAKAKQMERLGMGFAGRSAVSHSAVSDMKTLSEEKAPAKAKSRSFFDADANDGGFFDDLLPMYSTSMIVGGKSTASKQEKNEEWTIVNASDAVDPIDGDRPVIHTMFMQQPTKSTPKEAAKVVHKSYDNDEAQKKFGGAKAISSDQFFGNESSTFERSSNLARFQGSSSISSDDFFDDGTGRSVNRGANSRMRSMDIRGPNLDEVRESVRQGVTMVAGRLSTLASEVMTTIQDKYGG
ncbi:ADP-ribosylation factor GTPase-activating protein 2 [Phlebotomus argentipes]|uniref:ADP-ribosylation factor GTPase-activating protein 2 n=1 Tax=Phlebotomus argentipes TaxID=94469 RepID=UPI002892B40D|nr:ADP-ribosylation factor GTPase-activating protein 2 [Phlebotomus argentipes]